jgi:asparagine synthase (glutamine-hydrolysing)
MFAFAILDRQARRLRLVRDFFGIKPLYYAFWQEGLAFASEIKPLLELPGITRRVNPQRLYDYLYSGITDHGAETMFDEIKQLPPAHYIDMPLDDPKAARPVRYWDVDLTAESVLSFDDAAEKLRGLFLDSVRLHLRSDVPLGAALSGGIDSSSIVMGMRHLDRDVNIHTFSYIADDPSISEERWIDLVGTAAKAHVHKVRFNSEELAADLDHLIGVQGEPFISTSMYAQCRVFRKAREAGIKVMLDGQGADELLGGYPAYRLPRIVSLLRQKQWSEAWRLAGACSTPTADRHLLTRAIARTAPAIMQACVRRALRRDAMPSWLNTEWFKERGLGQRCLNHSNGKQLLKVELYRTLTETSLPQLLHYEDRNSMAFSIESRVPFLTPALAKFLFALPEDYIIAADGTSKSVFRQAMRGIVLDAVLDRRDKLGFPTPERNWLMSMAPWVESVLTCDAATQVHALNMDALRLEWRAIVQGARVLDSQVWRWINLILWVEKFAVATE